MFHTSGVETTDLLKPIALKGAETFSFHPIFSFASTKIEYSFKDIYIGIESDSRQALSFAKGMCKNLQCNFVIIPKKLKPIYHAYCVLISNYLTVLLNLFDKSFFNESKQRAVKVFQGLIESTMFNNLILGTEKALTGPIIRGDVNVIEKNLSAIKQNMPKLKSIYSNLGMLALELAKQNKSLSRNQIKEIEKLNK